MCIYIVRSLNTTTGFFANSVYKLPTTADLRFLIVDFKVVLQTLAIMIKSTTTGILCSVYQILNSVVTTNIFCWINQLSKAAFRKFVCFRFNLDNIEFIALNLLIRRFQRKSPLLSKIVLDL